MMHQPTIIVALLLLIGCADSRTDSRPQDTLAELVTSPQIRPGVYDHTALVAGKLPLGVEVDSATFDTTPTWLDGPPIYDYRLRFTEPGVYGVTFIKAWPGRDWPADRRTLEINVSAEVDAAMEDESSPLHPDMPEHPLIRVRVGQTIEMRWGGAAPFPASRHWTLERIIAPVTR